MIEKDIENIVENDFLELKENETLEGRTLEYKQALPANTKESKTKFLAGISSLANTSGGDFIIGIVASQGMPTDIRGIELENNDETKLRLEQLIKDGVKPRIPNIMIRDVKLSSGNSVFIIRVYKSWMGPHRVILGGHDKFYSRNSAGKFQLDVDELRNAFIQSEVIKKRIEGFRQERVSLISTQDTPISMAKGTKIVLHFIPLISMQESSDYELEKHFSRNQYPRHIFRALIEADWRFNFDGFLYYSLCKNMESDIYVQIFRNGTIEFVNGRDIRPTNGDKKIYTLDFERELIEAFTLYLEFQKKIGVALPIYVFLSIIDIKGYHLGVKHKDMVFPGREKHLIEKNILFFPEIIINNYYSDVSKLLMTWFNKMWNAGGYEKCLHIDENGNWKNQ